jgi:hypothetical protein
MLRNRAATAAFILGLAGAGHADGNDADASYRQAIAQAVAAFDASDFATARAAFERAHALSPSARTFRGIAITAFRQGDFLTAVTAFRAALADARKPMSAEQRTEATELLARADQRVGHATAVTIPAGATVRLDGRVVESGRELDVAGGTHVFRADLAGYKAVEREENVPAGTRTIVKLELPEATTAKTTGPQPIPASPADAPAATPTKGRLWTWVALGAVPVFVATGVGIWASGLSDASAIKKCDCTRDEVHQQSEAKGLTAKETWATVSYSAAGAAFAGAVILYFVEGKSNDRRTPQLAVGVSGTGVSLSGAF